MLQRGKLQKSLFFARAVGLFSRRADSASELSEFFFLKGLLGLYAVAQEVLINFSKGQEADFLSLITFVRGRASRGLIQRVFARRSYLYRGEGTKGTRCSFGNCSENIFNESRV